MRNTDLCMLYMRWSCRHVLACMSKNISIGLLVADTQNELNHDLKNQRMMFSLRPRRNKNDQQALCRSRGKQIYPKSGTTIDLFQVFIFSWDFNCLPFLGMTIIAKIEEYNPAFHILERG